MLVIFPSTNARRVVTGLLAGYGEVALCILVVRYLAGF